MNTEKAYKLAQKRVKAKKGFYWHLSAYVILSTFLILMNLLTAPKPWALFPIIGWGVGVLFHALAVFGIPFTGILGKEWEDKQIEKELLKLQEQEMRLFGPNEDVLDINEKDYLKRKEWDKLERE